MLSRAMQLLREATKAVPAVKYAVGIAGVMAAFALATALFSTPQAAVVGALMMLILMVLLLLFAASAALKRGALRRPALAMAWAILLLFIGSATLVVTSVFFDKPKSFPELVEILTLAKDVPKARNPVQPNGESNESTLTKSIQKPTTAGANRFHDTLLRYVAEAPSGFTALGAANQIGGWVPPINLPNAISCRGRGPSGSAFIECVLAREKNEVDAQQTFEEVVNAVEEALPGWTNSQMNFANWYFRNGGTATESTVSVRVSFVRSGADYDVTLSVYRVTNN